MYRVSLFAQDMVTKCCPCPLKSQESELFWKNPKLSVVDVCFVFSAGRKVLSLKSSDSDTPAHMDSVRPAHMDDVHPAHMDVVCPAHMGGIRPRPHG